MLFVPLIMMKNEENELEKCLGSILKFSFIKNIYITDTGSTDNSINLAKKICEKKSVELKIEIVEWKNFGYNRQLLFDKAKEYYNNEKDLYFIFIDCDMELHISNFLDIGRETNLPDCFMIEIIHDQIIKYKKIMIINKNADMICKEEVHEYWNFKDNNNDHIIEYIDDIKLFETSKKNRSDKYERDLEILKKDNNSRNIFYLANTYKDMGDYKKALIYYEKCIKLSKWSEEIWYCKYMLFILNIKNENKDFIRHLAYDAYFYRKTRIESLYYYSLYLLEKDEILECYFILDNLIDNYKYPEKDLLFIEYNIYDNLIKKLYLETLKKYIEKYNSEDEKIKIINYSFRYLLENSDDSSFIFSQYLKLYCEKIDEIVGNLNIPCDDNVNSCIFFQNGDDIYSIIQKNDTVFLYKILIENGQFIYKIHKKMKNVNEKVLGYKIIKGKFYVKTKLHYYNFDGDVKENNSTNEKITGCIILKNSKIKMCKTENVYYFSSKSNKKISGPFMVKNLPDIFSFIFFRNEIYLMGLKNYIKVEIKKILNI